MIVADTGAVVALIDADDRHHRQLRKVFETDPSAWLLPWAILPEVDYLVLSQLGGRVEAAFLDDVAEGRYAVEWGQPEDLERANELSRRYASLELGLTDAVVMAVAERLGASQIATLDVRDFGGVELAGAPGLIPRDL